MEITNEAPLPFISPPRDLTIDVMKETFSFLEPTPKEKELVMELYNQCPVQYFNISKIDVIENPDLYDGFLNRIKKLNIRAYHNDKFEPKWNTGKDKRTDVDSPEDINHRKEIYDSLLKLTSHWESPLYPHVKFLPVWHGTAAENLSSICHSGYAALGTTDDGYFGKGIYGTVEAEYAYRVYSKRKGVLILNWMAFYSAYPIIPKDKEKFKGQQHFSNYDAHYIPVSPDDPDNEFEENYFPCPRNDVPVYREMVVFEESSCYPRFLVTLSSEQIDQNPQICELKTPLMLFMEAQTYKTSNRKEYKKLLIQASQQGSELALYELGWYYKKRCKDKESISPVNNIKKESSENSPLNSRKEPIDNNCNHKDYPKLAFNCFHKAADRGLPTAKLEEAYCYKWGLGVKKDSAQAVAIFKTIKDPKADYELGFHYLKGDGVEKNESEAFKHWNFASRRYIAAVYRVAWCYEHGVGTKRDLEKAKNLFQTVVEEGSQNASSAQQEIHNIDTILEKEKKENKEDKKENKEEKKEHVGEGSSSRSPQCKLM